MLSASPPARPPTCPISMPGMRTRKKGMGINWDVALHKEEWRRGSSQVLVARGAQLTQVDETHKTKFSFLWRHGSTFLRVGDVLEAKRWIPQYI